MVELPRTPFLRDMVMHPLEKDTPLRAGKRRPLPAGPETPVFCKARDYDADTVIPLHHHPDRHQLVYAESGVLVVRAGMGRWVVPSTRAIWMPAGTGHQVHCIGLVQMRSLYIFPEAMTQPPAGPSAVSITPLLAALIRAAVTVKQPYREDSRDGRLMRLILDEMQTLPVLPLHLPEPSDKRLRMIARQLERRPEDASTLQDWAARLKVDVKTIQRLCARELGMTFGQWRQQARLLRALERLAIGEKVIDVALALGYESPSAFTTMFKRRFGLTPSQFFR
ncbi:HTH-type transcriptional repressor of iron proteins A [compost metagenome]